jgi:hypothetical protein
MATKRKTSPLAADADRCGLSVATYAPGDGVTRYRFFDGPTRHKQDYFGPGNGIYTALGRKDAETFIAGRCSCPNTGLGRRHRR